MSTDMVGNVDRWNKEEGWYHTGHVGYGKEFALCSERVGKSLEIFSQDVLRSVWKKNLFVILVKDDKEDLIQEGTVAMGGLQ